MAELTDPELERYARQIILPQVGGVGQRKLKAARVAVVGAGGIGSAVIPALAAAGVGHLTIIDDDVVDVSNLHRQPIFREEDVGMPKATMAAAFAYERNQHVVTMIVQDRLDECNATTVLWNHDLIIDGSDNFATRLLVSDMALVVETPLLSAAAVQLQGQVALFRAKPCYRCFVGDAFDSDDCDNCAELGVLGPLASAVGSFAALLAVNAIVGVGADHAGTLHLFDGASLKWRQIRIPPDPGCNACSQAST